MDFHSTLIIMPENYVNSVHVLFIPSNTQIEKDPPKKESTDKTFDVYVVPNLNNINFKAKELVNPELRF